MKTTIIREPAPPPIVVLSLTQEEAEKLCWLMGFDYSFPKLVEELKAGNGNNVAVFMNHLNSTLLDAGVGRKAIL